MTFSPPPEHSPNAVRKVDIQEAMMSTGTQPTGTREDPTMRHRDWMAAAEEEYRRLGDLLAELDDEDWAAAHRLHASGTSARWSPTWSVPRSRRRGVREMRAPDLAGPGPASRRARTSTASTRCRCASARRTTPGAAAPRPGRRRRPRGPCAGDGCRRPLRARAAAVRPAARHPAARLPDGPHLHPRRLDAPDRHRPGHGPRAGPDPRPRRPARRRRRRRVGAGARAAVPADA